MALQVTISGAADIGQNNQRTLTASVTDSEGGPIPAGLTYAWAVSAGSFVGATDGESVVYRGDIASQVNVAVTVTCTVTVPGNPNPTVASPSLTSLDELGITGAVVNMLITAEISGSSIYNGGSLAPGSDVHIESNLVIGSIFNISSGATITIYRKGSTGDLSSWWTNDRKSNYSFYFIFSDGKVLEVPGDKLTTITAFLVQFRNSKRADRASFNGIKTGSQFLLAIADTASIGLPDQRESATTSFTVTVNEPPEVTITAPSRLNPDETGAISVATRDPEGMAVTVTWEASAGTVADKKAKRTRYTAPASSDSVTLTCTGTDGASKQTVATHVITINSPPAVRISAPMALEVEQVGELTANVSDPNSDVVTVEWSTTAGTIGNTNALRTTIEAPSSAQTVTVTCTATDVDSLQATDTADITVVQNLDPTLAIDVPVSVIVDREGALRATVSDPTGDMVTVLWETTGGSIENATSETAKLVAPSTVGTVTVKCTATDEHGASTVETAEIRIDPENRPPVVDLNAPAQADPGATVRIEAVVTDLDTGDRVSGEWRAPKGTIANPNNAITTITLPQETGVVPVMYAAVDAKGARTRETTYITVGDPKANIYTPAVRIEIQGVDVTDRWIRRDGMTVGKSLDYPELLTFRSSGIAFNVDNEDGYFEYSNPNNFFLANNLPAHGRGGQVLIRLGLSKNKLIPVFAGEVSEVVTSLQNTKAQIKARDLSVRSRQKSIENFGLAITRRITDFPGANADYDKLNPVFYFPVWGLPISPGSVSVMIQSGEVDIPINIVETVRVEGVLSKRNAEIDYQRGLIRFELPPDDGIDTRITATWKQDYRYKRPDFLIRHLLKNTGVQDTLQITDDTHARFAIEQALLRHPTDKVFSSHGRPYFEKHGVVRWMMEDDTGDTSEWWLAHDNRLVKYDETLDEYEEITQVPDDTSITEAPPGGYGSIIESESYDLPRATNLFSGLAISPTRIYMSQNASNKIIVFDREMNPLTSENFSGATIGAGLYLYNDVLYVISAVSNQLYRYNPQTGAQIGSRIHVDHPYSSIVWKPRAIAVTADRFYIAWDRSHQAVFNRTYIQVTDHNGNEIASASFEATRSEYSSYRDVSIEGMAIDPNYLYLLFGATDTLEYDIEVRTHSGTFIESRSINVPNRLRSPSSGGLSLIESRLFGLFADTEGGHPQRLISISLADSLSYQNFIPYQFGTFDFDNFYFLMSNTLRADITQDSAFNRVNVQKYVRSTDTWTNLLDSATGQPQLAHANDLVNQIGIFADNRKNFQVAIRNNKTLIFYRRVQSTTAGIAYYNETDNIVSNIYSQNRSTNDGLPYSMDFVLDERTDGIYVYIFVVKYTLSGANFTSATLRVFRRRVEPNSGQSQIYTENFTGTSGTDTYPISVSDVILADDRSKFYFVLEYFSESTTASGKTELCTIAKSGSGGRTVLKTYDNPLLGPRSPAKMGSRYFYIEGGWVRLQNDDPPDENYYPDDGGHLIEINANSSITDHGLVWRSASKLDSPDPEAERYDGYGRHNAIVSNMVADSRNNLQFVCGYGLPYRLNNNLPDAAIRGDIPDVTNFNWIQYGQDLATKIASFPTSGRRAWDLIQQLAQLMGWEIGFGPNLRKGEELQAVNANISDWSANASFFFRPRTILPAKLRAATTASGNPTTLALNDSGLPAEVAEYPVPPAGERHTVIIDKEMFTYTGVTPDTNGRILTGVSRAQNGSTAAVHSIDAAVYFVDDFASGEQGTTLVSIQNRSLDFVNLKNDVNVGFGGAVYNTKKQQSIDENGEYTFNLGTSQPLLSRQDRAWAERIGNYYLNALSDLKEVLQFTLVFSPSLQPGQLVVVHQLDRVRIDFKLFRLLQVQHNTRNWQTSVTALEIIP